MVGVGRPRARQRSDAWGRHRYKPRRDSQGSPQAAQGKIVIAPLSHVRSGVAQTISPLQAVRSCKARWVQNQAVTDWSMLTDACGSAGHVPAVLDRFEADVCGGWSELMDHLCPQLDTAYSASFAALPRLAGLAFRRCGEERRCVVQAAGAIVACAVSGDRAFEDFAASIAVLHRLVDESLREAQGADSYVELLECLLAFEGVEGWDRRLEGLNVGEYEVDCPYCGVDLFIVLRDDVCFAASGDYALREVAMAPLRPSVPGELVGLAERLYVRAVSDGQHRVARGLMYLFGEGDCPDCGTAFSIADRVVAR